MTIELAHQQATVLRAVDLNLVKNCTAIPCGMQNLVLPLDPYRGSDPFLSSAGREALAAYDAKWVVVERKELFETIREAYSEGVFDGKHDRWWGSRSERAARALVKRSETK